MDTTMLSASFDAFMSALFHPFVMLFFGLVTHFGRKMLASKLYVTTRPCITDYWKKNPIQSLLSLIGAVVGYGLFVHGPDFSNAEAQLLNMARMSAFGVGFLADNIADAIGEKTARRITGVPS